MQVRVSPMDPASLRRTYAQSLVIAINEKLATGWNPLLNHNSPRALVGTPDALDEYWKDKEDLRPDSLRTYDSYLHIIKNWLIISGFPKMKLIRSGVNVKDVMELAGHSSLAITDKYVKFARREASEVIKKQNVIF